MHAVLPVSEWLPVACVGTVFTTLGFLKVYRLSRGIGIGNLAWLAVRLLGH